MTTKFLNLTRHKSFSTLIKIAFFISTIALTALAGYGNDKGDGLCDPEWAERYDFKTRVLLESADEISGSTDKYRLVHSTGQDETGFERGALWEKNKIDLRQGFKLEFNFEVKDWTCALIPTGNLTKRCVNDTLTGNITCKTELELVNGTLCGGEGFAFVIQNSKEGLNAIGIAGDGLGYAGIDSALAVEFDMLYSYYKGDPSEYHISVIANEGVNYAEETDSIGHEKDPLNFKNSKGFKKFFFNPKTIIEYLPGGTNLDGETYFNRLNIYLNYKLELSINLQDPIENLIKSKWVYFGFTGSTGHLSQNLDIVKPKLFQRKILPSESLLKKEEFSDRKQKENVYVTDSLEITILPYDSCKVFLQNVLFEEESNFKVDVSDESICQLKLNEKSSPIFTFYNSTSDESRQYIKLVCKKSGDIEISVTYNRIPLKNSPISLRILSQSLKQINMLSPLQTNSSNLLSDIKTSESIKFLIQGEDRRKNAVELNYKNIQLEVIDPLGLSYSLSESNASDQFYISQDKNLIYAVYFRATLAGKYTIRSSFFVNVEKEYKINVLPGNYKSIFMNPSSNYAEPRRVTKGTGLRVNFNLLDEFSNKIPFDDYTSKLILVELLNTNPDRSNDIIVMEPISNKEGITYTYTKDQLPAFQVYYIKVTLPDQPKNNIVGSAFSCEGCLIYSDTDTISIPNTNLIMIQNGSRRPLRRGEEFTINKNTKPNFELEFCEKSVLIFECYKVPDFTRFVKIDSAAFTIVESATTNIPLGLRKNLIYFTSSAEKLFDQTDVTKGSFDISLTEIVSGQATLLTYKFKVEGLPVLEADAQVSPKLTQVYPSELTFSADLASKNTSSLANMFEIELKDIGNSSINSWNHKITIELNPICVPQNEKAYEVIESNRKGLFRVYLLCNQKTGFGGVAKIKVDEALLDKTVSFTVTAGTIAVDKSIFSGAILLDSSKTFSSKVNQSFSFTMQLKDTFGNLVSEKDQDLGALFGLQLQGAEYNLYQKLIWIDKDLGWQISFTPSKPSKQLSLSLYFQGEKFKNSKINSDTGTYSLNVLSDFSLLNSKIIGTHKLRLSEEESFIYELYACDQGGNQVDVDSTMIRASIDGPFTSDMSISKMTPLDILPPSTSGSNVRIRIQKSADFLAGIYKLKLVYPNEPSKRTLDRQIIVTPGALDFSKFVVVTSGNSTLPTVSTVCGYQNVVKIYARDKYLNEIVDGGETLMVIVEPKDDLVYTVRDDNNGQYYLRFALFKQGVFEINIMWKSDNGKYEIIPRDNYNGSYIYQVSSNECHPKYSNINLLGLDKNWKIDKLSQIEVECYDIYQNKITTGGARFKVSIKPTKSTSSGILTDLDYKVDDLKNGKYRIKFTSYTQGEYILNVQVNNYNFETEYRLRATVQICNGTEPVYCPSLTTCVLSYSNCPEYAVYINSKCSVENPIYCNVNKEGKCVKSITMCDCPEKMKKCPVLNNKCFPEQRFPEFCPPAVNQNQTVCPPKYPFRCFDGSCKLNEAACPSLITCPIGYFLCPDNTCVRCSGVNCTLDDFERCLITTGSNCSEKAMEAIQILENRERVIKLSGEEFANYHSRSQNTFKCNDQSCSLDLSSCPSFITCADPSKIVCTDGSCADNEFACPRIRECPISTPYLCEDQRCVRSRDDCGNLAACGENFALCEDLICRESCAESMASVKRENCTSKGLLKCPFSFNVCANTFSNCPDIITCPPPLIKCPDGSCKFFQRECLEYEPSNGSPLISKVSCSLDQPVLCSNGVCVKNLDDCNFNDFCPDFLPFKCPTGECRPSFNDCPSQVVCPDHSPVLCPDRVCVKSKNLCKSIVRAECPSSFFQCPDGTCLESFSGCSTSNFKCPAGLSKCYDETCTDEQVCKKMEASLFIFNACTSWFPIRCSDGSCRKRVQDCPTAIYCPPHLPIKCSDNSCRAAISDCPPPFTCPKGTLACIDGSCSFDDCGTLATCSEGKPFKCSDDTCRHHYLECPDFRSCPTQRPYFCHNGNCVAHPALCPQRMKCPYNKPIRCADFSCVSSYDDCLDFDGCPFGYIICPDRSCRKRSLDCQGNLTTPAINAQQIENVLLSNSYNFCEELYPNMPFMCWNGMCTPYENECDDLVTGCPSNKPYRCLEKGCVKDANECEDPKKLRITCPKNMPDICPDGTCNNNNLRNCTTPMGCPFGMKRCGDGDCISKDENCEFAKCPSFAPYKCVGGLCVTSFIFCPNLLPYNSNECEDEDFKIPCADGRCVRHMQQCKPLYDCVTPSVRCSDGTCREPADCPIHNFTYCPKARLFRCPSGECAENELACLSPKGCPKSQPVFCIDIGKCAKSEDECVVEMEPNGCPNTKPFKCDNGECLSDFTACLNEKNCHYSKPVRCANGECVRLKSECSSESVSTCSEGQTLCPSGSCASDPNKCLTEKGCPYETPFRCPDGTCKKLPFSLEPDDLACKGTVVCPRHRDYMCADGSCQASPELCNIYLSCPEITPYRCSDLSCAIDALSCEVKNPCPVSSPLLCVTSGVCVSESIDCESFKPSQCPIDNPLRCFDSRCVEKYSECLKYKNHSTAKGRVLEGHSSGKEEKSSATDEGSSTVQVPKVTDQGCTDEIPILCSDGSCRKSLLDCPIIKGCWNDKNGLYRSITGRCVKYSSDNRKDAEDHNKCASSDQVMCMDGICRAEQNCPHYYGCPFEKPFHCPSGVCTTNDTACIDAAQSICLDTESFKRGKTFRCFSGECVSNMTECPNLIIKRGFEPLTLKFALEKRVALSIGFEEDNLESAVKLIWASNSFNRANGTMNHSQHYTVYIRPVADSYLKDTVVLRGDFEDLNKLMSDYPMLFNSHSNSSELNKFNNWKLSPVINISLSEDLVNHRYHLPILASFLVERIIDFDDDQLNLCLGVLENMAWSCAPQMISKWPVESLGTKRVRYYFEIPNSGIYAVIINTKEAGMEKGERCVGDCQKKLIIIYVITGSLLLLVLALVLYRVRNLKKHEKDEENLITGPNTANTSFTTSTSKLSKSADLKTPFPKVIKELPNVEDDENVNKLRAKTGIPTKNALRNVNMTVNPLYEMQDLSNVMNLWEIEQGAQKVSENPKEGKQNGISDINLEEK